MHPACDPHLDLTERDLVGDQDRRLQTGAAGLLNVICRRLGGKPAAKHALPGEAMVARVLEDRSADNLAEALPGKVEALDQPFQRRGQHLLVGLLGVGAVGARKRDAVAAHDHRLPQLLAARAHRAPPARAAMRARIPGASVSASICAASAAEMLCSLSHQRPSASAAPSTAAESARTSVATRPLTLPPS